MPPGERRGGTGFAADPPAATISFAATPRMSFPTRNTMAAIPSYAIPAPKRQPDAVTREVITGKLLATVDEMAIVLARASMSSVIYEGPGQGAECPFWREHLF